MKKTLGDRVFITVDVILLTIFALLCVFPVWYVICQSFSNTAVVSVNDVTVWPLMFTWANYNRVFYNSMLMQSFFISVSRTLIGSTLTVFCCGMAAYSLSKRDLVFKKSITTMILITMYFGGGLVPFVLLLKNLSLLNTFWVYVLPGMYSGFTIIIMRTFFKGIPAELEESAKLDGASDFTIFNRIYLALSKPLLATMFLFAAVANWNDWFSGAVYVSDDNLKPFSTVLMQIVINNANLMTAGTDATIPSAVNQASSTGIRMAAVVIATVPILVVYPFLQKYFSEGILIGSLKD